MSGGTVKIYTERSKYYNTYINSQFCIRKTKNTRRELMAKSVRILLLPIDTEVSDIVRRSANCVHAATEHHDLIRDLILDNTDED